jgi:hypothetical protein
MRYWHMAGEIRTNASRVGGNAWPLAGGKRQNLAAALMAFGINVATH